MRLEAAISLALAALPAPIAGQAEVPGTVDVVIEGARVHALVRGMANRVAGQPVFVLQAGAGSTLQAWGDLPDSLAVLAPMVAYDRPGLGGSDFDGVSPTPSRVAQQLHRILAKLGVAPPYVMVGHSWGGPLILYFAGMFPDEVAGMLYLDPSYPERTWETFFMTTDPAVFAERDAQMRAFREEHPDWSEGRKAESRAINAFWNSPVESRGVPEIPMVPTTLVLGTRYEPTGVPFMDRSFMRHFQEQRVQRFREWLSGNLEATILVRPRAGHFVHLYEPGVVTEAARALLAKAHR